MVQRWAKGYTMTEIVVVLTVISILAVVSVPTYLAVRQNVGENSGAAALRGYVAKARQVAGEPGNGYSYPVDLADRLASNDSRIVVSPSFGENTVSVARESGDVVVFARMGSDGSCLVVRDDIATDTQVYGVDRGTANCIASAVAGVSLSGDGTHPTDIDLP